MKGFGVQGGKQKVTEVIFLCENGGKSTRYIHFHKITIEPV